MKIHSLKIQNLAALKGDHEINFDEILSESNLFAITGDTGSGKSTILNAISLALYGQNYKSTINQTDYVTLGQSQARVSVIFSIGLKKYIAHWSCRLKKSSGEYLKNPKILREFYRADDNQKVLSITPEDVINLSFDQFCKTIILNQGQFAQFLTSSFTERKEIIEKLYQGEMLEKLSPTLRSQINQIKHAIEIEDSALRGVDLQEMDSLEELNIKQEKCDKGLKDISYIYTLAENLNFHFKELQGLHDQYKKNIQRIDELEKSIKDVTTKSNELKNNHDTLVCKLDETKIRFTKKRPVLQKCLNEFNELKLLRNTLEKIDSDIKSINFTIDDNKKRKFDIEKELTLNLEQINNLNEKIHFNFTTENIDKIQNIYEELKSLEQTIKQKGNHLESLQRTIEGSELEGKNVNKKIVEIKKRLEDIPFKDESYKLTLQKELEVYTSSHAELQYIESKRQDFLIKYQENKSKNQDHKKRLTKSNELLTRLEEKASLLEDSIKLYKLEAAINLCKKNSIEEHKCIICNSEDLSRIIINESEQDNSLDQQQKLDCALVDIQNTKNKIYSLNLEIKNLNEISKIITLDFSNLVYDFNKKSPLKIFDDLTISTCEIAKEISFKISKIKKDINDLDKEKELYLKESLELNNSQKLIKNLRLQYATSQKELTELKSEIEISNNQSVNHLSFLKEVIQFTPSEHELAFLYENIQYYKKLLNLKDFKLLKTNHLQDVISNLKVSETKLKTETDQEDNVLKRINHINKFLKENIGDTPPQEIIDQHQASLERMTNELQKIKQAISNEEVLKAQIDSKLKMSEEQISQSKISFTSITSEIIRISINLMDSHEIKTQEKHLKFLKSLSEAKSFDQLATILSFTNNILNLQEELKIKLDQKKEEFAQLKLKIADRVKINDFIKSTQKKINELSAIKIKKENLYKLVGRDEFRNFVLSLIEKELIIFTNNELKQLCNGRYELIHINKNKVTPDFYIVDKYKEGLTRKVSTLSGGETFMVSLAMALALAEMTRGQNEIDSFFIDEGFGTLDSDSLENILEMLQNLHLRGKQIGIISHVKSLTDRILANIKLTKDNMGSSTIGIHIN